MAGTYFVAESAVSGPSLQAWALRDGFVSLRHFALRPQSLEASFRLMDADDRAVRFTAYDREIPFWYVPFDALRYFDLPQLLSLSRAAGMLLDPIDGDWQPLNRDTARRLVGKRITVASASDAEVPVDPAATPLTSVQFSLAR
jgi:hypothetical protein